MAIVVVGDAVVVVGSGVTVDGVEVVVVSPVIIRSKDLLTEL